MQSSTNNNDFLCYGDAEGLNSGSAPPFVPNSRAFGEEHPNQDPSGGLGPLNQTPDTPQQPQINPRDGIINYLVYQGLLTPDLQLTISPTLLNTIISSATHPISHTSNDFSASRDTSVAPAIDSRNFQATRVINTSPALFHEPLPPPSQYSLSSSTLPQSSSQTHNPITTHNISSSEIPRHSNTSIPGHSRNTHNSREYPTSSSFRNVNSHFFDAHPNSPPTTAGVDIFHSHETPTPNPRSPQPIPQAATSSVTTFHHTPITHPFPTNDTSSNFPSLSQCHLSPTPSTSRHYTILSPYQHHSHSS